MGRRGKVALTSRSDNQNEPTMSEITQLLDKARQGDAAARERFFTDIYTELERLARQHLARQAPLTLLDPPALVRESWLRIEQRGALPGDCRGEFLAYASQAMRSVIIDYIRSRKAERHGGGYQPITLTSGVAGQSFTEPQLELLADGLDALQQIDERAHRVVEMRFFAGMELAEIAQQLAISLATVKRDWTKARAFLLHSMSEPVSVL
jgi:RNA polymerase sigma factor (TIGR02999 family)